MRIVAHTPHGTFKGKDIEYCDEKLSTLHTDIFERLHQLSYITFETPDSQIYMTKEMIAQSVFVVEK